MQELLHTIHRDLGELRGTLDSFCERLEKHHHEIYGNGSPGLKIRMDRTEQTADKAAKSWAAVWGAIVSVAGAIVAAVVGFFKG